MQDWEDRQDSRVPFILAIVAALAAVCIVLSLFIRTGATRYLCTICGASKTESKLGIGGAELRWEESIEDSPITLLRAELIAPCSHDWAFNSGTSSGGLLVAREQGCAFAYRKYPVGSLPEKLVEGLRLFEDKDAVVSALEAIGNRNNKLRFLAADAARTLAYMTPEERKRFDWQTWWSSHREAFTICRDPDSARAIAEKYLESDDRSLAWGAEETILWLERAK